MLAKNFKKYFLDENSLVASYEWIRDLFQDTPEGLSTSEEEIFIDFTSSEKLKAARGLLTTDHVILNHGQVTWMTPELAPLSPNYHTTPTGKRFNSQQI
ncbi:hypothetical protein TNCV_4203641 [Trichonephila clavipes]|nr:hypothetical protein TNCV_2662111 [Trichonephila clavipes]GFU82956.1 hypothetical protein TNCV_4203641 [Trichonephila clavipes]